MNLMKHETRALSKLIVLALACAGSYGCVADRPARNGVFNENQYLRKDWLVRQGDSDVPDRGWVLKATVTEASEPNVFGDAAMFALYPGSHSGGDLVHFQITSDKMLMINSREIDGAEANATTVGRVPEAINSWPVTNVDLKYRINLDGEKSNFYEENQELPWDQRQWVKVSLDRNDASDLAPLGSFVTANVAKCADMGNASTTLVPNSFKVDEKNDYMEWVVQVQLPIKWDDADCVEAFGPMADTARRLGRQYETVNLKYSMVRAVDKPTYQPMTIGETDPIRHKYGPITYTTITRDTDTGLLAANEYVVRFDPTKPIVWYFEKGFPDRYKNVFTRNGLPAGVKPLPANTPTIEDATNKLFEDAKVTARISFKEWNAPPHDGDTEPYERTFGDVRFNLLRFLETYDQQSYFAGVTSGVIDPRTGESLSQDIVFSNFAIKDYYVTRIDAYLQSLGASADLLSPQPWPDPTVPDPNDPSKQVSVPCVEGATVPIVQQSLVTNHNGQSTLFQKMQSYLYKPADQYGPLGPQDFTADHTQDNNDFYNAYFAYVPYLVYADPELNPFVTPEGSNSSYGGGEMWQMIQKERQFHEMSGKIDRGEDMFDVNAPNGSRDALSFLGTLKNLTLNHRNLNYARQAMHFAPQIGRAVAHADAVTDFAMERVVQRDARHCTGGHWETKEEWINALIDTYWSQVIWHEFGHAMGLEHNFMGSLDKTNFPVAGKNPDGSTKYALYSSSVMEYNAVPDRVFWGAGWGPYDAGAISWIYGNPDGHPQAGPPPAGPVQGISGQVTATYPWNDPKGFAADGREIQYLFCNERHTRYTPLCRAGDLGTTPSEIAANDIENYEWQYKWRNFRQYRKIWDDSKYADTPANFVTEQRRFLSLWAYDMSSAEVTQALQRIGVKPPAGADSAQLYYEQLTQKFTDEMSHAASLAAAFHEAIIQQTSGQRPYVTVYDHAFGAVTQQGIALDKLFALQSFTAVWPVDNYDPNQSAGRYIASYSPFGLSSTVTGVGIGATYETVGEQAVDAMTASPFDAFAYFRPLAIAQFTNDSNSLNYISAASGALRPEVRDWAGGRVFGRLDDFIQYFRDIAFENNFYDPVNGIDCRERSNDCKYDPRTPRGYLQDTHFSDPYNEFLGPDARRYIWVYVPDRNQWVVADRDRNSATYTVMRNYTTDVILQKDDGNGGVTAFTDLQQVKYFIDYYTQAIAAPH